MIIKLLSALALFIAVMALGFVLRKSGNPYNKPIFTIHKLAALALLGVLGLAFCGYVRTQGTGLWPIVWVVLVALSSVALFASGVLLGNGRNQGVMAFVHLLANVLFVSGFAGLMYVLFTA